MSCPLVKISMTESCDAIQIHQVYKITGNRNAHFEWVSVKGISFS